MNDKMYITTELLKNSNIGQHKPNIFLLRYDGVLFQGLTDERHHPYVFSDHRNRQNAFNLSLGQLQEIWEDQREDIFDYFKDIGVGEIKTKLEKLKNKKNSILDEETKKLWIDCDQEINNQFLRMRIDSCSGYENKYDILFRIESVGVDWYDLICKFIYINKPIINSITISDFRILNIMRDEITYEDIYKYKGTYIYHLTTDEFLCLPGKPIID